MGWWRKKKSKTANEKQSLVHENGKILRATDKFSHNNALYRSRPSSYQCYRGMLEDRLVLVKKWVAEFSSRSGKTCRDIAISSMTK
ncbi:Non-functional pseudokinase ZRK6 [Cardamine amara subsp. amara]|uniref:Non-functional pseudokinase ZRK6 n=1 Tax=Cardamine amara subsp. amara TaxID=228776 RepID=A0ABD1AJM7_CARAN